MKYLLILAVLICLSGCSDGSIYEGLILKDKDGNEYILEHNVGDTYFIQQIVDGRIVRNGKSLRK